MSKFWAGKVKTRSKHEFTQVVLGCWAFPGGMITKTLRSGNGGSIPPRSTK